MANQNSQVGFLGLGIMGYPMARHLLSAGHKVASVVEHIGESDGAREGRQRRRVRYAARSR